jgi:two-component system chemotaxis sensor kinase CheA
MEIDLDKILQVFATESQEHLSAMEEALVGLETQPQDLEFLEVIFRGAHTIKGNAASLGFPKLAGFAHAFEEILQHLRNHSLPVDGAHITLLLRAIDTLRGLLPRAIAGRDELGSDQAVLNELVRAGEIEATHSAALTLGNSTQQTVAQHSEPSLNWSDKNATIRVDKVKLDRMLDLAGEIAIAQSRLGQILASRGVGGQQAWEAHQQVEHLTLGLQEEILQLRMLPLGPTFRHYLRVVRDMAQSQGKSARLELEGEDVEVDVSVVEYLKDPLVHMIRNAIDHGIEHPEKRRAIGKDPCGRLMLKALHEGANIVIQVIDDGTGLDRERIIERARLTKNILAPEKLVDTEIYRLIFEPGFSTASAVTEWSGRGVGMDVVRRNIEALRGSIAIESQKGGGTTITIRLPLTLAIIEGFGVGVGNDTYVLPLHAIVECVPMPPDVPSSASQGIIDLRGEPLPFIRLRDWFRLPNSNPRRENIVVVEVDQSRVGLAVDALYGTRQTVIKPLGKHFRSIPGIAGSAILGSGRVALILDVTSLVRDIIRSRTDAPSYDFSTLAREFTQSSITECR